MLLKVLCGVIRKRSAGKCFKKQVERVKTEIRQQRIRFDPPIPAASGVYRSLHGHCIDQPPAADGGLRGYVPACPGGVTLDPVPVRRLAALRCASFRPHLAVTLMDQGRGRLLSFR